MKRRPFIFILIFSSLSLFSQRNDSLVLRKIFAEALSNGKSYAWLDYLSNRIGGRLSGSPEAAAAVEFTRQIMDSIGLDTVYLQEVMVPYWVRGEKEQARTISSKLGEKEFRICALGGSAGTGDEGITASVVEVKSFEELAKLGNTGVEGKIVFFNRRMDPAFPVTFDAYGGAVNQRSQGAAEAAKYGAVGVIVRSMNPSIDDFPHTGGTWYKEGVKKIPAAAISTLGAEELSKLLKRDPGLKFYFRMSCRKLPDVKSYNVIGEIRGSEKPEEIIAIGGHLDSWDNGDGAHDDGAGCVQTIEALRIYKTLGIKPKRTVRVVMWMNEENGLRGGRKYAEAARQKREKHIAAIESDRGGFTPRGFDVEAPKEMVEKVARFAPLLDQYGVGDIKAGHGGADIGPLKDQGVVLMELVPDSQRYFDFHHTEQDKFEFINRRELEMGGAAIAALVYLLSEYGL